MAPCTTCSGSGETSDNLPLPTSSSEPCAEAPVVTPPCPCPAPVTSLCTTIKDQCSCLPPDPQPFAKLVNDIAFAIPACQATVEVTFEQDVSNLIPGLEIFAIDLNLKTIRLSIVEVVPFNKLVLTNKCSACCGGSKPVGEAVSKGTLFTWTVPQCCTDSSGPTGIDCLVGTFFFPAVGATSPANVPNAFTFAIGGIYSMGGFLWKVTARVTDKQILLENVAPGNGSTVGGFIDGGNDGVCRYPITPISDVDECADVAATSVSLVGCTAGGRKKLTGTAKCGVPVFDPVTGQFTVQPILQGSALAGPHYVAWDPVNPCNSKLVYAPDLAGAACATTLCAIYLSPANPSGAYEVEVSDTAPFGINPPNSQITIAGKVFTVTAIVVAGQPGKIQFTPVNPITVSETVPLGTKICTAEGCQPFPRSAYPFPPARPIELDGQLVYCANDGLRTNPGFPSYTQNFDFLDTGDIAINSEEVHDGTIHSFSVTNPSLARSANAIGTCSVVYRTTLIDTGDWRLETKLNPGVTPPVSVYPSIKPMRPVDLQNYDTTVVTPFALTLLPGETVIVYIRPTIRTITTPPDGGTVWTQTQTRVTVQVGAS